ncbi:DUF3299 domain-containing protein [Pseudoteredinibacter isoporae]|uniref:DUF3299 domain-containing protein n=1 Tax=Pseudoteredinibacter isoporae TaxID=570281 RepID=A0A7X0MW99_9GAMM|nr:DUF3299 domain-containing protein [Pseudoteredinibacter isoporae]MBB6522243.1 hypothetical protein [Pseudoteredinibacter isoporae]NHO87777.1 DUF3299 domain-containing protein [Pseudoteredinibacter isoporae]NIB23892.1 DUF3299 domain-containing protein [Pseudoteredinibacter isoporae]
MQSVSSSRFVGRILLGLALLCTGFSGAVFSADKTYKTVSWFDLLPEDDLKALTSPPEGLEDIEEGSYQDTLSKETISDERYWQALESTEVVSDLDNSAVRIPGFIVPLDFDDPPIVTEFFVVPYFGACLHMPPPPPNQIVYVKYPDGLKLNSMTDAFWLSGVMTTNLVENEMAKSAYTLRVESIEPYTESEE